MTAIAEFDQEPDSQLLRKLLLLLLVSAIVHGVSLSALRWSPEESILPLPLPIELSMLKPQSKQNPVEFEEQQEKIIEPNARHIPVTRRKKQAALAPAPELKPEIKSLDFPLPPIQWQTTSCTAQQKRTAGHVCAENKEIASYHFKSAHEDHVAELFREQRSVSAEHGSDLRAIGALLAQQAALDEALRNFDTPPAHLLSEKHRINDELKRIDKKYASMDLLKIIGSTYQTAKKIVRSGGDD